jgi:hypothetical protein
MPVHCRVAGDGIFANSRAALGGRARYVKELDAEENTVRFAQEIFDSTGGLVAVHEKFPVDLGHKQL